MKTVKIELSSRLAAVAAMVTPGSRVCDVGCDHGFTAIYLVQNGISESVIAMDVNRGPLENARKHIEDYALSDYIETRLSNGLQALLPGEADTLICAGMGGGLICRILEEEIIKAGQMKEFILQPQSQLEETRRYLRSRCFAITDEAMILEEGKYYPILRVLPGGPTDDGARLLEDRYGPVLLREKNPVLLMFLHRERKLCREICARLKGNSRQSERNTQMLEKLKGIEEALFLMEGGDEDEV